MTQITSHIVKKIAENSAFRQNLCLKSHYWFFVSYFSDFIQYPCEEMHKKMLYFSGMDSFKKMLVVGFPECGKSLIHSFSLPIWSMINGKSQNIIILLGNKKEQTIFSERFEEMLNFNQRLNQDFQLRFKRKGLTLFFPYYKTRIRIGNLEENQNFSQTDLIIIDPLYSHDSSQHSEIYEKFKSILERSGTSKTKKILVGRSDGASGPFSKIGRGMLDGTIADGRPIRYPFFDQNGCPSWNSKFHTREDVLQELDKAKTPEEFFFEYLFLEEIPNIPLLLFKQHFNDTYPVDRSKWGTLSKEQKSQIEEIFFIPYQGDLEVGRIIWGIKIKTDENTVHVYQGVEWEGSFNANELILYFEKVQNFCDAQITFYGDTADQFSLNVCQLFTEDRSFGSQCNHRRNYSEIKDILKNSVILGDIQFQRGFGFQLNDIFMQENEGKNDLWTHHLSLVLNSTCRDGICFGAAPHYIPIS